MTKPTRAQPESNSTACSAGGPPWLEEYKCWLRESAQLTHDTAKERDSDRHFGAHSAYAYALEKLQSIEARLGEGQDDRSRAAG